MLDFFFEMGPVAWPLLAITIANLVLIIKYGSRVFGSDAKQDPAAEAGINAILFWGVMAAVLGYLGMYGGVYRSLTAIAAAGIGVNPGLVAKGISEAISDPIAGLLICVLSAVSWFVLRSRHRQLAA